jgi:lipopolysaccharide export system permease protein
MKLYQKYIAKNILASTALVLTILLALYTFMDFIEELDDLGRGSYDLSSIGLHLLLTMPMRIYELLPVAALIGSVLGLGTMASNSELVALRAAGVSVKQVGRAVLKVAIILSVLALFVGEVIRPPSEQAARETQSEALTGTIGSRSEFGFWTRDGNHFNHIKKIEADGSFSGISIYEFDASNRLRVITRAATATYDGESWLLKDVLRSIIDENGVEVRSSADALWHSQLNPGMVNIVVVPAEFLPVWDLLGYISYLKDNHQSVERYQLAFWDKVMMPVNTAIMVLLAVPFIFGPLRSSPVGGRILLGTLVGVGFHLVNQSFQQMGLVFGLMPILSATLPALLFAMLGYLMLRRAN